MVVESWRADVVDPQIMPKTHAFASRSVWFRDHYSAGNGTRMGIFAIFYGLHGPYWFAMLDAQRSPVLMDLLQADGYQMELYTSQSFTYPEFDRTIFANVPRERMHVFGEGARSTERDRVNVNNMLDFIDRRDPNRPFMTFMFFETTHAKYDFLPANVIRRPYLEDFNYATMGPKDAPQIKNRYINSSNCLDGHIGRVLEHLERRKLLDSTIVVLTGDHGEEFMEKGRWGHASECFHEEEIRTPLILHAPHLAPRQVTGMTSHADIPPTVMKLLGVTNSPEDYCLGRDLLGGQTRDYVVLSGWSQMAYVDRDCKIVMPTRGEGLHEVTTLDDGPVSDQVADEILRRKLDRRVRLLKDLRRFSR
jgi:membrane-anchored protein YejM (alkaline phosphatase superfamily)